MASLKLLVTVVGLLIVELALQGGYALQLTARSSEGEKKIAAFGFHFGPEPEPEATHGEKLENWRTHRKKLAKQLVYKTDPKEWCQNLKKINAKYINEEWRKVNGAAKFDLDLDLDLGYTYTSAVEASSFATELTRKMLSVAKKKWEHYYLTEFVKDFGIFEKYIEQRQKISELITRKWADHKWRKWMATPWLSADGPGAKYSRFLHHLRQQPAVDGIRRQIQSVVTTANADLERTLDKAPMLSPEERIQEKDKLIKQIEEQIGKARKSK